MKKKIFWNILFIVLVILTIRAVWSQYKGLSFAELAREIEEADKLMLTLAIVSALGFIYFEGRALLSGIRAIGYKLPGFRGFLYSAADIYFSSVTPSASGGQPASAYFMIRDGVSGSATSAVLFLNLMMYTLTLLALTLVFLIISPGNYTSFGFVPKVLILIGGVIMFLLSMTFLLILIKPILLFGTLRRLTLLLSRMHIIRDPEKHLKKFRKMQAEYKEHTMAFSRKAHVPAKVFFYNILQRLSQYLSIVFLYLAFGGSSSQVLRLLALQNLITLGSFSLPIPGGVGIIDYLMLEGYSLLMDEGTAARLMVTGRGLTFYVCLFVSILTVGIGYFTGRNLTGKYTEKNYTGKNYTGKNYTGKKAEKTK